MAEKAQEASAGGDFVVSADFTRGPFDMPGFAVRSHTQGDIAAMGLPLEPKDGTLWFNWDYICPLVLSWDGPEYDYYVVTESDAAINVPLAPLLDRMRERDIGLLVGRLHDAPEWWHWHRDALSVSDRPMGCILCVSIFSRAALEAVADLRREMAAQRAAGARTDWPFCEAVVPAAVRDAGLGVADLAEFADIRHFDFGLKFSENDPRVDEPGTLVHSVVAAQKKIDLVVAASSPRDFVDHHEWIDELLRHEKAEEVAGRLVRAVDRTADHAARAVLARRYPAVWFSETDVAERKPTAASSLSAYSKAHLAAESDDLTRPGFDGDFAFHTDKEREPYVIVDFLASHCVRRLRIGNRRVFGERFSRFSIETSNDGTQWRSEAFTAVRDEPSGEFLVAFLPAIFCRFVKITSLDVEYLHLRYLKAEPYHVGPAENLAPYISADMSSISRFSQGSSTREEAQRLLDGALHDGHAIHSATEAQPWWEAAFDAPVLLTRLAIRSRAGWRRRFLRFAVKISADGVSWKLALVVLDGQSPSPAPEGTFVWHPAWPLPVSRLRIQLLEHGLLDLNGLEVTGHVLSPPPESGGIL